MIMIEEGELEEDRGIVVVRAWANTAWHRHDAAMGGRGGDTFLCLEHQYKSQLNVSIVSVEFEHLRRNRKPWKC